MDTLDAQANNDGINSDTETGNDAVPSGVQERINELTGKFRELERMGAEKDRTINQLTERLLELSQRGQAAVAQPDPLDAVLKDIDPDDARRVDALVKRAIGPLEQRIAQLTGQLQETQARGALAGVQDPAVRQKAQQLIDGWRRKNVYGSVATDEDAVLMAEAMVARERRANPNAEREAFNRGEQPLSGVRALPTAPNGRRARVDLSGLDADQLAAKLRANPELEDQLDIEL